MAETVCWFRESENPHFSHFLTVSVQAQELVFPDLPAEVGRGHALRPGLGVSAVEEGHGSGILCPVLGLEWWGFFSARTVPPCGLALFLALQHLSLILGPS